ncbi:MAG TPA: hypothetical protein VJM82_05415 [Nitrospiraceae bacterium]|nr:hypothetical protein [Nitrospiraceae bacterium]
MSHPLKPTTVQVISRIFKELDYSALGRIYCDEGGEAFWKDRRGPCQKLGIKLAEVLRDRLRKGGRSLYVGAGVAEIPVLTMETMELSRQVAAFNLRADEVALLNQACKALPFQFLSGDARAAMGKFDHIWMVSTLNDPERFPELSALSYGRANPVTFNPTLFVRERDKVFAIVESCLNKLKLAGLVTTSLEEIPWITDWCTRRRVTCVVEEEDYPTAIVEDPVCFIRIGDVPMK